MNEDLREQLAAVQHDIWSHWMKYMFIACQITDKGRMIVPKTLVDRWERQMNLSYKELTESERDSDRNQARKVMKVLHDRGLL